MKMTMDQITGAYPNVAKLESQAGRELLAVMMEQLQALAAENVGLKSGVKYFSYSEMSGFEEYTTAELAMKSADADLASERDEASSEGWSEETDTICWGVIMQKAVEDKFEKPSEDNGWVGWSDYTLLPANETPNTDRFVAEMRAQGVDMAIEHLTKKFEGTGRIGVPVMALEHLAKQLREVCQ